MGKILLPLIAIPLLEAWLLIRMGGLIGALPTIALVIATAVIGGALVKRQGLQTVARMQMLLNQGELPSREIAEGVMILLSAALLITPGFFTDGIGFLCLWPAFRRALIGTAIQRGWVTVVTQAAAAQSPPPGWSGPGQRGAAPGGGQTIDGDFVVKDEPSAGSAEGDPPRRL